MTSKAGSHYRQLAIHRRTAAEATSAQKPGNCLIEKGANCRSRRPKLTPCAVNREENPGNCGRQARTLADSPRSKKLDFRSSDVGINDCLTIPNQAVGHGLGCP